MKHWSRYLMTAALFGLLALGFSSCSQGSKQATSSTKAAPPQPAAAAPPVVTTQPGVQQKALPPTKPPTVQTATITFLTGDVQTNSSGSWQQANIGDELERSEQVKVGTDSYCEIQFGNLATARIEANSEVSIAKLALGQTRQVNVALSTGAIVSKVQKLIGNDQYDIATPTAVAGVRGTEFRVAASSSTTTELSVKEGVVTVVPAQASISAATPQQQAVAEQVVRTLTASAPRVTANQQLVVTAQDLAPVVQQLTVVKKRIDAGASANSIKSLVDTTAAVAQKSVPKPVPISQKQQAALAVTSTMQLLPTAAVAPQGAAKSGAAPQKIVQPVAVPLTVNVVPGQAQIYLNGELVGTNGFSGLFTPGQNLSLSVRLQGYDTKEIPIKVPGSGVALTVSLTKSKQPQPTPPPAKTAKPQATIAPPAPVQPKPAPAPVQVALSVNVAPSDAQISVNGTPVGTGSYQGRYTVGQQLQVDVQAPGYNSESRTVTVAKGNSALSFQLTRKILYGNVAVSANPSNADIYVNGQYEGTGSFTSQYQANTSLQIRASLRGYSDATSTLTVAANTTTNSTLTLHPQPIDARLSVSGSPLVRALVVWNDNLISVDKDGTIRSTSRSGNANWQVSSGDNGNENSCPVVADGTVFLSGARTFVGVDASTGAQLFSIKLGQSNAHLFGRSVTVANGEVYYPTDNAIVVYGERTGQVLRRLPLPNSSNMSPLVSGKHIYIVDQQGTLYDLSSQTGQVNASVSSSAVQPVATIPVVLGSQLFFAGRRGTAVLADLSNHSVVWQKPLESGSSVGVFTDPVFTSSGIYVFGKGTLFGLSPSSGSNLFTPITNVSAAPLVDGTALYYGTTDGRLVKASALTGATEAAVNVGGQITTRPVAIGDDIAVGTESGQIVLVYPGTMPTTH